jgi:hypothetical protein
MEDLQIHLQLRWLLLVVEEEVDGIVVVVVAQEV